MFSPQLDNIEEEEAFDYDGLEEDWPKIEDLLSDKKKALQE